MPRECLKKILEKSLEILEESLRSFLQKKTVKMPWCNSVISEGTFEIETIIAEEVSENFLNF